MDHVGDLSISGGYDAIMVAVDRLTKMAKLIPTYSSQSAPGTPRLLLDNVWTKFGFPESIFSDRGGMIVSKFMKSMRGWVSSRGKE
jgi:hypothetical protein